MDLFVSEDALFEDCFEKAMVSSTFSLI